jgi:hypothetical protein
MRRAFVSREDFERLRAERADSGKKMWHQVNEHTRSLAVMQERLAAIPDHRELSAIAICVGEVQGDMKAVKAGLDAVRDAQTAQLAAVNRIQDYLMRPGA